MNEGKQEQERLRRVLTLVRVNWTTGAVVKLDSLTITSGACYIGAGQRCDVVISRKGVADPVHALLTETSPSDRGMVLQNCAGPRCEPVQVNGSQVVRSARVNSGDIITIVGRSFMYEEWPAHGVPLVASPAAVPVPEMGSEAGPAPDSQVRTTGAAAATTTTTEVMTEVPEATATAAATATTEEIATIEGEGEDTRDEDDIFGHAEPPRKRQATEQPEAVDAGEGAFVLDDDTNNVTDDEDDFGEDLDEDATLEDEGGESSTNNSASGEGKEGETQTGGSRDRLADIVYPAGLEPSAEALAHADAGATQMELSGTRETATMRRMDTYKARRRSLFKGYVFVFDPALERPAAIRLARLVARRYGIVLPFSEVQAVPADARHYFIARPARRHTREIDVTPHTLLAAKCGYVLVLAKFLRVFLRNMRQPTANALKAALPLPNRQGLLTGHFVRQPYPAARDLFAGMTFVLHGDPRDALARQCWAKLLALHGATLLPPDTRKTHVDAVLHAERASAPVPALGNNSSSSFVAGGSGTGSGAGAGADASVDEGAPPEVTMSWAETCMVRGCRVPLEPFFFYPGHTQATTGFLAAGRLDAREDAALRAMDPEEAATVASFAAKNIGTASVESQMVPSVVATSVTPIPVATSGKEVEEEMEMETGAVEATGAAVEGGEERRSGTEKPSGSRKRTQGKTQGAEKKTTTKTTRTKTTTPATTQIERVQKCKNLFKRYIVIMEDWAGAAALRRLLARSAAIVLEVRACYGELVNGTVMVAHRTAVFVTPHDARFAMMPSPAAVLALLQGIPCVAPEWATQSLAARTVAPLARFMPRVPVPCGAARPRALVPQPLPAARLEALLAGERRRLRFVMHDATGGAVTATGDMNACILEEIARRVGAVPAKLGALDADQQVHFVSTVPSATRRRSVLPDAPKTSLRGGKVSPASYTAAAAGSGATTECPPPVTMFWLFDSIFSGEVRSRTDYAVDDAQVQHMLAYMREICGPQPPRARKPRTPRVRPPPADDNGGAAVADAPPADADAAASEEGTTSTGGEHNDDSATDNEGSS